MALNKILDSLVEERAARLLTLVNDICFMACPICGQANLAWDDQRNTIVISCTTPVGRNADDGEMVSCAYHKIVNLTDITKGTFGLQFKEPEPPKPKRRPAPKRTSR